MPSVSPCSGEHIDWLGRESSWGRADNDTRASDGDMEYSTIFLERHRNKLRLNYYAESSCHRQWVAKPTYSLGLVYVACILPSHTLTIYGIVQIIA